MYLPETYGVEGSLRKGYVHSRNVAQEVATVYWCSDSSKSQTDMCRVLDRITAKSPITANQTMGFVTRASPLKVSIPR
jgi:hypothetical protein